jgi:hypothetical protein
LKMCVARHEVVYMRNDTTTDDDDQKQTTDILHCTIGL